MFTGLHAILHTREPERLREFFRDILEWNHVDAGGGWLIFAAPPTELAMHPIDGPTHPQLYLMCDDLDATIAKLKAKGVTCTPITQQRWGRLTSIRLPDGSELGLYQPQHPTAISLPKPAG